MNRVLHRFPRFPDKYPEQFKTSASIVGFLYEYEVYELKRICDIHCLPKHITRYNRLSNVAVPLLHLPGSSYNRNIAVAMPLFASEPASGRVPAGSTAES